MQCRHFGSCGGCTTQHLPYAQQLHVKQERLRRLLGSSCDVSAVAVAADSPWRFRHKIAFAFGAGPRGRGLVMGHYAAHSRTLVPIEECPVHSDRGNRIAFALRDRLVRAGLTAASGSAHGVLRHLIVRTSADEREAVAMLVVSRNDKALRAPIRAFLASDARPDGFLLNINDRPGPLMVGRKTIVIAGRDHVIERLGGVRFRVSPAAFFQTNPFAAEALQACVVDAVGPASPVLDLYAGSGLLSLPLAAGGATVTAVEENRDASEAARLNLRLNRVPAQRLRVVCARVEEALPRLAREPWSAVVLDPPRDGCSPAVLEWVFERMAPPVVLYVTCNPDGFARELPQIASAGYLVEHVRSVDMFPHTDHIEAVVQLRRR